MPNFTPSRGKWTPGPWIVSSNAHCVIGPHEGDETAGIAACGMRLRAPEECEANGRLIAAAPEMYTKLDKIAGWLEASAALKEKWITTCRFASINEEERTIAKNYRSSAANIRKLLSKIDGNEEI
jgi:hypothetical protein